MIARPPLTDTQIRAAFWLSYLLGGDLALMIAVAWRALS